MWDLDDSYGVVAVPEQVMAEAFRSMDLMREASTFGDLEPSDLAPWAVGVVERTREDLESDGVEVTGDTPWVWEHAWERAQYAIPMPHDASRVRAWFGEELFERHVEMQGDLFGGDLSWSISDPQGFLEELREDGWELAQAPGLMQKYWEI